ncbi:DNA polymerase [Sporomusa carbonis]|uniref:DNA polymerase n=1 Tax=Sporomusa carbonis TaxID=3076075 RepID=UPI003C7C0506
MKSLSLDLETYSSVELGKSGLYKYVESPDFEILLFGYSVDGGEIQVVDLASGESVPPEIVAALTDDTVIKWAFNANFERICLSKWLGLPIGQYLDPRLWRCTMVWSAYMGLPLSLEGAGAVLGLEKQKLSEGKDLIRYFCQPCKPTAANGQRTRNLPSHAPDKWAAFKAYNRRDVETELSIQQKLAKFPVPEDEWRNYILDQKINDRGIRLDMDLVREAVCCDERARVELTSAMRKLTNVENPNSVAQMKVWLAENGLATDTLGKPAVKELIKTAPENLRKVLALRQDLAKSSVKKYKAMENAVCDDSRLHGMFQFYGANRTGRFCLTGDHEILTPHGWRRLDSKFNGWPIAAQYDLTNNQITFAKCPVHSFEYKGDMYEWQGKRISQISTPEHRNPVAYHKKDFEMRMVVQIKGHPRILICGQYKSEIPRNFTDDEIRLLVAYQADGIAAGGRRNSLAFRLKKDRKIERMRSLLDRMGLPYKVSIHKDGVTCIRVEPDSYNSRIKTKQFGWWLINENADVFFDELKYWDGHVQTKNSSQYCTTNRLNAEIVATFAHLSGRAALINTVPARRNGNANLSEAYYVEIWENAREVGIEIRSAPQKQYEPFMGRVYCLETTTGCFLVRRDKKIWVTGNSSKVINIQNLPQNHLPDLEQARSLVKSGNFTALTMLYDSVPAVLSELIRTAFIPKPGLKFIVADFSAIEARVIAWLAGETWRNEVFASHGKIYEASASRMFHVPIEEITKGSPLRQKGKIAELALGYGGSVGALKAMGAIEMGLSEEELRPLVTAWRSANPNIVKLWWDVDKAAVTAVRERTTSSTHGIRFECKSGMLFITLPSGRRLAYVKPRIDINQFGSDCVIYEGVGPAKKWERIETYGPKLVENIVQAISRDILCYAMGRLDSAGFSIVMSVHDEVVLEVANGVSPEEVCRIMAETPPWAKGLLLRADGYDCTYYKKD